MPASWYLCPYVRTATLSVGRACAMDSFTVQIRADGGGWSETEVLGNRAIVKVNALQATLDIIAATATFRRIPMSILDDKLSTLNPAQRNAIVNELTDAGYTVAEVTAAFPNVANHTLREVLHFLCQRRLKPRYDAPTDTIICDGIVQACRSIESVDSEV